MIEAISTSQDIAQFLFEAKHSVGVRSGGLQDSGAVSQYWDSMAGALVNCPRSPETNHWKELAQILDSALQYE